jgi:hypothetical protein
MLHHYCSIPARRPSRPVFDLRLSAKTAPATINIADAAFAVVESPLELATGQRFGIGDLHTFRRSTFAWGGRRRRSIRYTAGMAILVGMDEAGYGPNLGPLVVAATAWEGEGEGRGAEGEGQRGAAFSRRELYDELSDIVTREACTDGHLAIADSKTLYHSGGGLRQLERGVHAALVAIGRPAARWSAIVDALGADPAGGQRSLAWHADFDCRLPVDASADEVTLLGARLVEVGEVVGMRPIAVRARLVFPAEFNELVEVHGSKGVALSRVTLGLLREVLQSSRCANQQLAAHNSPTPDTRHPTPAFIVCDKHGGRNQYGPLLQQFFPDDWIERVCEGRAESRYQWGPAESRVEVAFRTGGEAFLPTALASMTAKYLRELAMRAFNEFWCTRVPGLRLTAGYPVDARRYKAEIGDVQRELGIDDHLLWRSR